MAGAIVFATGVAAATPVRVVSVSDGSRELLAPLDDREPLTYSYRQSIYDVPVYEEFVRHDDVLDLQRVRSPDIRSVEYFGWTDGRIEKGSDGLWYEDAPPPTGHRELVLRVAPLGQQRIASPRWSCSLLERFGEVVVTVRVEQRPRLAALIEALR